MTENSIKQRLHRAGLIPHQVDFVEQVLQTDQPMRILLTSFPGTGKSVAISAAIGELASNKPHEFRCLVVVPAILLISWQAVLKKYGDLDAEIVDAQKYRRLELETLPEESPWTKISCAIVSIDRLKIGSRIEEVLIAGWDVVVLDEVHICTAESRREKIAQAIWESKGIKVAIAATPLLHEPEWLSKHTLTRKIAWSHRDIRLWDQSSVFPRRDVVSVRYNLSPAENDLFTGIEELVHTLQGDRISNEFYVRNLLQRRASSLYAIEMSLRRYVTSSVKERLSKLDAPDMWIPDDSTSQNINAVEDPLSTDVCRKLLDIFEQVDIDSKWNTCKKLMTHLIDSSEAIITVFTNYVDTAQYLGDLTRNEGWQTYVVSGQIPMEERWALVDQAKQTLGILIVTSAVIEGGASWFSKHAVHYDLPWEPIHLLERFWLVERVGNPFPEVNHHFLLRDETREEENLKHLTNKVIQIEHGVEK